jgi:hypothetical protein
MQKKPRQRQFRIMGSVSLCSNLLYVFGLRRIIKDLCVDFLRFLHSMVHNTRLGASASETSDTVEPLLWSEKPISVTIAMVSKPVDPKSE